jgi:hypothetical protein
MRRRTLHHQTVEATEKFFVLKVDRIQFAIPLSVVLRVLSPKQPIEWDGQPIPTIDLRNLTCDAQPLDTPPYTLILHTSTQPIWWGLQTPTIPNLMKLSTQSIKTFPLTESDRPMSNLSDRFITVPDGNTVQTLFLINLPHLEASIDSLVVSGVNALATKVAATQTKPAAAG